MPTGVLEAVAKKRGCIIKGRGGELDLEKAAMILLTDYRSGALGRISLETPDCARCWRSELEACCGQRRKELKNRELLPRLIDRYDVSSKRQPSSDRNIPKT